MELALVEAKPGGFDEWLLVEHIDLLKKNHHYWTLIIGSKIDNVTKVGLVSLSCRNVVLIGGIVVLDVYGGEVLVGSMLSSSVTPITAMASVAAMSNIMTVTMVMSSASSLKLQNLLQ